MKFWKFFGIFAICSAGNAQAATYSYVTLNVPDASSATAYGINDPGLVVGAFIDSTFVGPMVLCGIRP